MALAPLSSSNGAVHKAPGRHGARTVVSGSSDLLLDTGDDAVYLLRDLTYDEAQREERHERLAGHRDSAEGDTQAGAQKRWMLRTPDALCTGAVERYRAANCLMSLDLDRLTLARAGQMAPRVPPAIVVCKTCRATSVTTPLSISRGATSC